MRLIIALGLPVMLASNAVAGAAMERKDIPDNYKWRPDHIYSSIEAWQKDFDFIKTNLDKLAEFKGKFAGLEATNPPQALIEFNNLSEEISKKFSNIWVYVMFNYNTDMSNSEWVGRTQMLQLLAVE
jgi:oligoendopeptidase F